MKRGSKRIAALAALGALWAAGHLPADELQSLPLPPGGDDAPGAGPSSTPPPGGILEIRSDAPFYIDNAITMVPVRPLCDFLGVTLRYHNGIATLEKLSGTAPFKIVTLRTGGEAAQVVAG